jgi:hypothetical protein
MISTNLFGPPSNHYYSFSEVVDYWSEFYLYLYLYLFCFFLYLYLYLFRFFLYLYLQQVYWMAVAILDCSLVPL